MPASLRAFIAIELPVELREALKGLQARLRQAGLRARWVRPEGIHLTLKFLGDISAGRVPEAVAAMQAAAGTQSGFRLEAAGIGVFPGPRRPRVIWVGLRGETDALEGLQRRLDDGLSARGFPREDRPFRGHLTIGRFPDPVDAKRLEAELAAGANARFGEIEARELVLFKSELKPEGAVYTPLSTCPLKAMAS